MARGKKSSSENDPAANPGFEAAKFDKAIAANLKSLGYRGMPRRLLSDMALSFNKRPAYLTFVE